MEHRACMRCGSTDLLTPGVRDGVTPETGGLAAWTCRACGLTSAPVTFGDRRALGEFQEQRALLYRPGREAPALRPEAAAEEVEWTSPPRRSGMTRALAALIGLVFMLAAFGLLLTAILAGGEAWFSVAPMAVFSILLGAPFVALARKER